MRVQRVRARGMRVWVVLAVGLAIGLTGCGEATGSGPAGKGTGSTTSPGGDVEGSGDGSTATAAPDLVPVDPGAELVGMGMVMQSTPDGPVELCVGAVLESYPPQCSGPALEGAFDWADVEVEEASGVTWSNESYYGVGHLDLSGEGQGTLTLTRPLSLEPPEGYLPPDAATSDFPQLCEDPTADVPDVDQAARTQGTQGFDEEQALLELLPQVEGYVTSWVSDGGPLMNVVVTSQTDVEQVRDRLRAVYQGPLCVEARDLPTGADVQAAQDALAPRFSELRLQHSGAGASGLLDVGALVADEGTIAAVHETVAPWLTPDQVVISSTFHPLQR